MCYQKEPEVANEMGISKQAVNRMKQRALDKLRKKIPWTSPPASASSRIGNYPNPKEGSGYCYFTPFSL